MFCLKIRSAVSRAALLTLEPGAGDAGGAPLVNFLLLLILVPPLQAQKSA